MLWVLSNKYQRRTSLSNQELTHQKSNAAENLLTLRRRLKLTQREFIDAYLVDAQGEALISLSTLSGIENGTGNNVMPLVDALATKLEIGADLFAMEPDAFAKNIDLFLEALSDGQGASPPIIRSNNTVDGLVHELSSYLTDAIISGELKPGDKLPSDRNLSVSYGVGRSSIREALKVLSALGLINILPGQGTFIASENTDFFLAPLSWTLLIGQNNTKHLLEMRSVLEIETASLAAQKADQRSLAELTEKYESMQKAYQNADFQAFLDADLDFHLAIARCSGNPIFYSLLQTSRKLLTHISKTGMISMEHLREIADEHHGIYTAIISGNEQEAKEQMNIHLKRAGDRYRL